MRRTAINAALAAGLLLGSISSHSADVIGMTSGLPSLLLMVPVFLIEGVVESIAKHVGDGAKAVGEKLPSISEEDKTNFKKPFIKQAYKSQLKDFFAGKAKTIETPAHWFLPNRDMAHLDRKSDRSFVISYFYKVIKKKYSEEFAALTKEQVSNFSAEYRCIFEIVYLFIQHGLDLKHLEKEGQITYATKFLDKTQQEMLHKFLQGDEL